MAEKKQQHNFATLKVWLYHQVPAPVTQTNTAVSPPALEEEPKEDGEEFEDLSAMLEHLGLSEYKKTFDEERIDIESFVRKNAYNYRCILFFFVK